VNRTIERVPTDKFDLAVFNAPASSIFRSVFPVAFSSNPTAFPPCKTRPRREGENCRERGNVKLIFVPKASVFLFM
jgi:hypothetical protein